MNIRESAKGLVKDINDLNVLVAGKHGRLGLPGGGLKEIELNDTIVEEFETEAFFREIKEEIGLDREELINVDELFLLEGETTSEQGISRLTFWTVFKADIPFSYAELFIPYGSEITGITGMTNNECLADSSVHDFTKRAIYKAMELGL